jgi:hypothetical protein
MQNYIILILIAAIAIQEATHRVERKDLYNRIMAKDLQEYKTTVAGRHVPNAIRKKTSDEVKRRNSPE